MSENEDVREQAEREEREAKKRIDALRVLTKSEGWHILNEFARAQADTRKQKILYSQLDDVWTSAHQEFTKGEVTGIEILMGLPKSILDAEDASNAAG